MHATPRLLLVSLVLASAPGAQARSFLVDLGDPSSPSAGGTPAWNDVDPASALASHALVDEAGAASGLTLAFLPGRALGSAVTAGVQTPTPGSALAALGWPVSAMRDAMWNSSSTPVAELLLTGLDPTATYDLTCLASRLGVSDVRTVTYEASNLPPVQATLDAANNTSEVVTLAGLSCDAAGTLSLEIRAATSNTNSSGFYYLNALRVVEHPAGTQPPLVAPTTNRVDVSRREDRGPYTASLSSYTNDGSTPLVQLAALDLATGQPPAWLSLPASATAGSAFALQLDPAAALLGANEAELSVQAAGYAGATTTVVLTVRPDDGTLNLLFYGNSYSIANGGVPDLVGQIAVDAGRPAPRVVARLVGGQNLAFHLNDPGQAAAITQALPLGEEWDFVVMQGYSLEATSQLGDPAAFIANAAAIVANVRAHSPAARACLYQTWARGRGHSYYLEPNPVFSGPLEMHLEIEASYRAAAESLDLLFGPGTGLRAAAGECVALSNFVPDLYEPDLSHPRPPVSVMAGMAIFSALYGQRACDVEPDFAGASALAQRLLSFGLELDDWHELAGLADRTAAPGLRRFPGSGEDVLLRTGVLPGRATACAVADASAGDDVQVRVTTPVGTYAGAPAVLWLEPFATGLDPLSPALFPELHVSSRAVLLGSIAALPGQGWSRTFAVPVGSEGSYLVQAQVLAPSARTGHAFTTTDGHELRVDLGGNVRLVTRRPR